MKQKNANDQQKENLYEAIALLKGKVECENFLLDLCTPAEIEAMVDRWEVANLLLQDMSYRAIAKQTGVSVTTVTRVARFLFNGNEGYKTVLKRMEKM